ncbi:MAG TPA: class I SAM-dependent methyltransferase [Jatrophihabitans sp.]|nr:class I SAM-dependent methyltransferase [Jatrophihabitans sp.]
MAVEVSPAKLRGGFYSPQSLVRVCLDRVQSLLTTEGPIRLLEPSAGDGAFVAGIARHPLGERVSWMTAIEIVDTEAGACRSVLANSELPGAVVEGSALAWATATHEPYDAAVGNPPFVRFQFVDSSEATHTAVIGERTGVLFKGVSNLWLPILVSAVAALRPGGAFAFIVPAECFTGVSGHHVREWIVDHVHELHVDLFPPGSFPGVLQEVVILSGRVLAEGDEPTRRLRMRKHGEYGMREWTHQVMAEHKTWTRYLLTPELVAQIESVLALESVGLLGGVAKFEVATVTGANTYFCVADRTLDEYDLREWARPLLPRTRHAAGLIYTAEDHKLLAAHSHPAHLLDFAVSAADPLKREKPRSYLQLGEAQELHLRYKCSIRTPWYQVPVVAPGVLMMAKRSHLFPRVVVNDAGVLTTDTIYRGRLLPETQLTARAFAAAFHNSLTLLTAEIEGRSFGGGVLELVPSEISRLAIPHPEDMGDEFDRLDWVCRSAGGEESDGLIEETDRLVTKKTPGLTKSLMDDMREARDVLLNLRLARN